MPHAFGLFACVLGNVVLTALMFSVLMSRYGKVRLIEMQALNTGNRENSPARRVCWV